MKVKYVYLLFIQHTGCIMWKEHFFHKKNNADTVPVLKKIYHEHKCGRCLATMFFIFNLYMFDWGYPLRTYTMHDVSDIIFPRRILYKESNYCVFVFILASVPHCLFLATVVIQDLLDNFDTSR